MRYQVSIPECLLVFTDPVKASKMIEAIHDADAFLSSYSTYGEIRVLADPPEITMTNMNEDDEFMPPCTKCQSKYSKPDETGLCESCRDEEDEDE